MARSGKFGLLLGIALLGTSPAAFADADKDQALASLRALGADVDGSTGRCAHCHSLSLYTVNRWGRNADQLYWTCFDEERAPNRPAIDKINCMRSDPANPNSGFEPQKLGFYAGASHLPYFENMFKAAFPAEQWEAKYNQFRAQVQMPSQGDDRLAQADVDGILAWTKKGLPYLEALLGRPGDPPSTCSPVIKDELRTHIQSMATEGWEAKNLERGMMMFGCSNGATKLACFDQKNGGGGDIFPEASATTYGSTWTRDYPAQKLRVLREITFRTSYWMRSSADGRFFANGARSEDDPNMEGGMVSDLQNQLVDGAGYRDIPVRAAYDPGFFPDDSGFMFQGTQVGAGFCSMAILQNQATTRILFNEPGCSGSDEINLYQSVGASLDGSDYLAISGSFESDGGQGRTSGDNIPGWFEKSYLELTPIINDGQRFKTMGMVQVWQPFFGDWGLSPSNLMVSSRVSGIDERRQPKQMGMKFHLVEKTRTSDGYKFALKDVGTVCVDGNKGAFSFDERFFATYHYVDADDWQELGYASADDRGFKDLLTRGSANIYVVDLLTGQSQRLTRMGPGQFALFPHYRSDGWMYFMAVDRNLGKRFIAATDGGIRMSLGGKAH